MKNAPNFRLPFYLALCIKIRVGSQGNPFSSLLKVLCLARPAVRRGRRDGFHLTWSDEAVKDDVLIAAVPDCRKSLRERLRGPQPSHFQSFLATCAFAPATLKAYPVFRGCGVLRTVLAPSALRFASGLRNTAKMAFSKAQIFDLRLKMHSPPRLLPIRPRTALTLVRGYALCGALRAVLKG